MAGQMSKHKINIGLTSLILIFIILCLATFSLLSLSSARGDQSLAARSARAVTEYYRADAEGEKWLKQADAILQKEMTKKAMDQEEIQALAKKMALELGCDADEETGFVSTDISMDRGQALHIDLALTGDEKRGTNGMRSGPGMYMTAEIMRSMILCLYGMESKNCRG